MKLSGKGIQENEKEPEIIINSIYRYIDESILTAICFKNILEFSSVKGDTPNGLDISVAL